MDFLFKSLISAQARLRKNCGEKNKKKYVDSLPQPTKKGRTLIPKVGKFYLSGYSRYNFKILDFLLFKSVGFEPKSIVQGQKTFIN